jgi:hypothetical protein
MAMRVARAACIEVNGGIPGSEILLSYSLGAPRDHPVLVQREAGFAGQHRTHGIGRFTPHGLSMLLVDRITFNIDGAAMYMGPAGEASSLADRCPHSPAEFALLVAWNTLHRREASETDDGVDCQVDDKRKSGIGRRRRKVSVDE